MLFKFFQRTNGKTKPIVKITTKKSTALKDSCLITVSIPGENEFCIITKLETHNKVLLYPITVIDYLINLEKSQSAKSPDLILKAVEKHPNDYIQINKQFFPAHIYLNQIMKLNKELAHLSGS